MPTSAQAKEIIERIPYITLATVDEQGMPWNSPVFAAYDKDYTFYFGTHIDSQKARNIKKNENVFIIIYDSTVTPGDGAGVYIKAIAKEITDSQEIAFAHKLIWDRHVVPYWKLEEVQGDAPIRLYKAIPEKVWMNGEGEKDGHYIDTRVEIQL
jgi:general stress protein 26